MHTGIQARGQFGTSRNTRNSTALHERTCNRSPLRSIASSGQRLVARTRTTVEPLEQIRLPNDVTFLPPI